jgi:hemoglobin
MNEQTSLYERLGGYDAITAVVNDLLSRLMADAVLGRFWSNRGDDGIMREKQLLVDYLCMSTGGSTLYTGRDNVTSHRGMNISEKDWDTFIVHLNATLNHFKVPDAECAEVLSFIQSTKSDIVE